MDVQPETGVYEQHQAGPRPRGRIADIEVLRGVSIIMVMASHIAGPLLPWPTPMLSHISRNYVMFWPGVDLFFAISGFVIARSLLPALRAAENGQAFFGAVLTFWVRRAWRLLPAAWLWLAVITLLTAFFNRFGRFGLFHDTFESVVAALLSVANFHFAAAFRHFGTGASAPYWSLSLEEQFYLLLPVVVFLSGRYLVPVLIAASVVMFAWPEGSNLLSCLRLQPILLGVLLALLGGHGAYPMVEPAVLGRVRAARVACLVAPLFLMAALAPLDQRIIAYPFDGIAVLAFLLVFVASFDRDYTMAGGSLKHVLIWMGARSYALYLIHTPVFLAINEASQWVRPAGGFDNRYLPVFLLAGLGITLGLAEVNYRLVEQPLRRHGVRMSQRLTLRWAVPDGTRNGTQRATLQ
jgi:peptidoglycan/LPS O-acetylase OafA/YrhL